MTDCRCGDSKAAHQHHRRGSECSLCPCRRYRRPLVQVVKAFLVTVVLAAAALVLQAQTAEATQYRVLVVKTGYGPDGSAAYFNAVYRCYYDGGVLGPSMQRYRLTGTLWKATVGCYVVNPALRPPPRLIGV